uniref:Uncharacterized protein n=1 Tax=Eucampia antarctica TaxID=49252 RepID=A0A7S2R3Q0_9STRA|mmetsp:Transcript_15867/g.15270  ORF Transcript_15867/g.15270 Transcript_15867/m.15270 type:complete len:101 (+) Transcript_15867:510-812(+)
MLADFLTKPLQGKLLRFFRAVLLGHKHISALSELLPTHHLRDENNGLRVDKTQSDKKRVRCVSMITEHQKWEEGRITHPGLTQPLRPETICRMTSTGHSI